MKSFGDMVKQAQKMQKQMAELQEKLAEERFEASAGGGMVTAVVDGKQMLKELKISPEALKENDVTLLEDLILTAVGEAQRTSEAKMNETHRASSPAASTCRSDRAPPPHVQLEVPRAPDRGARRSSRASARRARSAWRSTCCARRARTRCGWPTRSARCASASASAACAATSPSRTPAGCAPTRSATARVVCVVEQPGDVLAFERTGAVPRPLPRAGRRAVAARRHARPSSCASASCSSGCGRRRRRPRGPGGHPRHQSQRGRRGDGALPLTGCWRRSASR